MGELTDEVEKLEDKFGMLGRLKDELDKLENE